MSSVSFINFEDYKKKTIDGISSNVDEFKEDIFKNDQELTDSSNSLVVWVHKINNSGDHINFIEKKNVSNIIFTLDSSESSFTSSIYVGQVYPKIIQKATTFCITFNGYVKLFLQDKLFFEKQVNEVETVSFEYTFLSNNPVDFLCNYKTFENNSHFEIKCCTSELEDYYPKYSSNDTNINFKFETILNPFGKNTRILGESVDIEGTLNISNDLSSKSVSSDLITSKIGNINNLHSNYVSTNSLTVEDFGINSTSSDSGKDLILDSSKYNSISFNSKTTNINDLSITDGTISHNNQLNLVVDNVSCIDIKESSTCFNNSVVFSEKVTLENSFNVNKLSIGLSEKFQEPSIDYPVLGKLNIIGDEESPPNLSIFNKNNYDPVFQICTSNDNSLIFDGYYDNEGNLRKSQDCENIFQIKKKDNFVEWNTLDGQILNIDLFKKSIYFKECINLECGINLINNSIVKFTNIDNTNVNIGIKKQDNMFYISDNDANDILLLSTNGLLKVNTLQGNNLIINEKFKVDSLEFNIELDLTTTRPICLKNSQDYNFDSLDSDITELLDTIQSKKKLLDIPSICTLGGGFINKHLHVNRGISTKRIKVSSNNPCIILDSTKSSLSEPILGTGGVGSKLILQKSKYSDETDLAFGTSKNGLWYSVSKPNESSNHSWYFGKQKIMNLDGVGNFTIDGNNSKFCLNGLEGIYLNSKNLKNIEINLNDKIHIGQVSDTFYITSKNDEYFLINQDKCLINSESLHVKSLTSDKLYSNSLQLDSTKYSPSCIQFEETKILDWSNKLLNLSSEIVNINSDNGCNINTSFFQVNSNESNDSNNSILKCSDNGIECNKPINVIELHCKNGTFENLYSNLIISKIVESKNGFSSQGLKLFQDVLYTPKEFEIQCSNLNISSPVHINQELSVKTLKIEDNIEYFNGQYKTLRISNSSQDSMYYYIGKLNTTNSGFGLDESGKLDIDLTVLINESIIKSKIHLSINQGEINLNYNENSKYKSSIQVYSSPEDDYHVFLYVKPICVVFMNIYCGNNIINECDEGNESHPNGINSKYSKSWEKVLDTFTEECNSFLNIGSISCNNTSTRNLEVHDDLQLFKNTRLNTSSDLYVSDKKVLNYSQDTLSLFTNLESENSCNIGSTTNKWNEFHVNSIFTQTIDILECNVVGKTCLNKATIKDADINNLVVEKTVTESLFVKKGLSVGKGVTLKDKLIVDGKTQFNNTVDSKNVNVFGILKTNVLSSEHKPLKIVSSAIHLQDNFKIELDKTECKISTMIENVVISPGGLDLLKIGINGKVIIGSRPEYTLSPLVDLVVYGKMCVSEGIIIEKDLDVKGILSVNSVKVNNLYSTSSNKVYLENIQDCIKLYPNGQLKNFVCIDSDLRLTTRFITCNDITTETLKSNKLNVSNIHVDDLCVSNLCVKGETTVNFNNNNGLCIEISNSDNSSCFNFTNDGTGIFKSEKISVNELSSSSTIYTQDLHVSHNLCISESIELKKGKYDTLDIINKRGNVNLFAAGNKGLSISQVTGNATLSGLLEVNSGLDLFTTGQLDTNAASLLVKGGASIYGSLSVNKKLLVGNVLFQSLHDSSKDLISFTLPETLPESNEFLICNPQGELTWGKVPGCNHVCKSEGILSELVLENNLTITSSQDIALKVEKGDTILQKCTTTEIYADTIKSDSTTTKYSNVESLTVSNLIFNGLNQLNAIIPGKKLIGESKNDKILVEIVYKYSLPDVKYTITGNLVSTDPNDSLNNIYICSFKKLTKTGCVAIIKVLDSDELSSGWSDKTLCLHYLLTL